MKRYLITGAQGLIGRYLVARILEREKDAGILGIGRSRRRDGFFAHAGGAPMPPQLAACFDSRFHYLPLSLGETGELRKLIRSFEPHCIFHLASALHSAPERDFFETNVQGTISLMEAASGSRTRVILGSSASVYGEASMLPIPESHPCKPADLYGVSKLTAEHLVRVKAERASMPFVIARIFNVVGPGQTESHVCGRFAAQLASLAGGGGGILEVGPLDSTRDFIDVRDVAAALLLLAHEGERSAVYNVGSGRETPVRTVLSELIRISGLGSRISIAPRDGHGPGVTRHAADVSKLRSLGFEPAYPIVQSLEDLFGYCRSLSLSVFAPPRESAEKA